MEMRAFTLIEVAIVLFVFIIGIGLFAVSYINLVKQHLLNQRLQASLGNLRLALEKIWRDLKYGTNFNIVNEQISFYRAYDCADIKIGRDQNTKSLFYVFKGVKSVLTDPNLIEIEKLKIFYTTTSDAFSSNLSTTSITISINANVKIQNLSIPINLQTSIAPIYSVIPSPCK